MKKLLLILLCLPVIGFGQQTYVPDDNFEQELINLGYDSVIDDSVLTSNINTVINLNIDNLNISDISGIQDFIALTYLSCQNNQLTSLDVSNNISLKDLRCYNNQLTSLDVSNNTSLEDLLCYGNPLTTNLDLSNNTALKNLWCFGNQLTNLDLSNNTALERLFCWNNNLTSLDLSNNSNLFMLNCYNNQLTSLNVRNGNNSNFYIFSLPTSFDATNNQNLYCIDVDDISIAQSVFSNIDPWASFSTNCANALGCTDSVACNYDSASTINDGSCIYNQSFINILSSCDSYVWDGVSYDSTGQYTNLYPASNGCDSIVTLDLTITSSSSSTVSITECDSYVWDGVTYDSTGQYTNVYPASNGCDSIVTLDLIITNSSISTVSVTNCDSYTWIDGNTYTTSNNTATHTLQTVNGCDSIINLDLTITGNPNAQILQFGFDLQLLASGGIVPYVYLWNTLETSQVITPTSMGTYWCIITDVNGCNSDTVFYNYTTSSIDEINTKKRLLKITDLLGRETKGSKNQPLLYIYDDGTVETRIVIE